MVLGADIVHAVKRLVAPLERRVKLMVGRAIVAAVDDSGPLQLVQLETLADNVRAGVGRLQEAGFTSVPIAGRTQAVYVAVAGRPDLLFAIATDDGGARPTDGDEGEVRVFCALDGLAQAAFQPGGKVAFGVAGGAELVDLVEQLVAALQAAVTATSIGNQPLDPATQTKLTTLKTSLAGIKGAL